MGGGGGGGLGGLANTATGGVYGTVTGDQGGYNPMLAPFMPSAGLGTMANAFAQGGNPLGNLQNIMMGNGAQGQHGPAAQAAAIEAATGPRPEMAAYKSILNEDGSLNSNYAAGVGPAVTADAVSAGKAKAQTVDHYGKVKVGKADFAKTRAGSVTAGQLDTKTLKADTRASDAMRDRALSKGASPWLKMQMKQQGIEEKSARDSAARQALSGAATARSQLAMRGGLQSGARQRIAMNAGRDMNAQRQMAARAGQQDRLGLRIADDQAKLGLMGQTAGLDLAQAQQGQDMSKFNVGTALDASKFNTGLKYDASKTNAANKMDISKYNTGMAYDASKTNVANALDAKKFNASTSLDASKFNTGLAYDASKTNAANNLQAGQFNSAQAYDANKFNAASAQGGISGENQYNMSKYGQDMMGYAAGKQGAAIAGGGKK